MKQVRIKIVCDNRRAEEGFREGWGFSAVVEAEEGRILFDVGNDREAFYSNLEKMGVRLEKITEVMFSHRHQDHIAGCREILGKLGKNCSVYVPKGFSLRKIPNDLTVHSVEGCLEIREGVFSLVLKGGLFLYEQILIVQIEKGLVIVTGCAHPGIVTILEEAQKRFEKPIYCVIGGFHLFRKSDSLNREIVNQFQSLSVKKVAPCHCSGDKIIGLFEEAYRSDFYQIGTGSVIEIE